MAIKRFFFQALFLSAVFGLLMACARPGPVEPPTPAVILPLKKIEAEAYPNFVDDLEFKTLAYSLEQSLVFLRRQNTDREFLYGEDKYTTGHLIRSVETFLSFIQTTPSLDETNRYIRSHYTVYQSTGGENGHVLYTGYYEPFLKGSLTKTADFSVPLYRMPKDLISLNLSQFSSRFKGENIVGRISGGTFKPYYDRKEIDTGRALSGKAAPLVWLKSPVDAFFLHVQGSGRIFLTNGQTRFVHYHASNGRPYRSIGRLLIETEKIPRSEMSMQRIRTYLENHPEKLHSILNYNPSYVFFKFEENGPIGYLETLLTPGRSLAVDRRLFPPAALCFIETQKPVVDASGRIQKWESFSRFVSNQDTGGAIRGAGRADLFWGNGPYAEIAAGFMQHPGRLYLLVLKKSA